VQRGYRMRRSGKRTLHVIYAFPTEREFAALGEQVVDLAGRGFRVHQKKEQQAYITDPTGGQTRTAFSLPEAALGDI